MKKALSMLLTAAIIAGCLCAAPVYGESGGPPTLTVDMTAEDHGILHGSAGFLYGISNEGVPDVNTLTPLKPKVLATKGALGTEHPYGDALDVAEEFFEAGGQQVQMYNSNYYGVFGVTADAEDYGAVLKDVIAPTVAKWKDERRDKYPDIDDRMVYIPINEGTPANVGGGYDFNRAWKIYYDAVKSADPGASIAGPNDAVYRGGDGMRSFLLFCRDNNCLPDVVTWHELQVGCLDTMDDHIRDYRQICGQLGIEEKQVVINEYADYSDCGVPGRLVNWIARLEDCRIYGCLPFWHQANNLNDLAANANQGNGAWWVYKWYGDMSGTTLNVSAENTGFDGFYGLAAIDGNKRSASVICGGADGEALVRLDNVDGTEIFKDAERVHIKVEAAYFTGYHGAAYDPETVFEGTFPVVDGGVSVELKNALFSTAYRITVTEETEEVPVTVGGFHAEYEAEDAARCGDVFEDKQYEPLERPSYYCSGGVRVGGIDSEGDGIRYGIDVPVDGLYRLAFLYGNGAGSTRNNADTHSPKNITQKLIVDGEEEELLLPNTLFYAMEGSVERYVDLTAGRHSVALMYNGQEGAFHDALYVSYAGAYGRERPGFDRRYEAEAADFNLSGGDAPRTENAIPGYSGNGYVTGLETSRVEDGGGIRWVVDAEDSGLYHLQFRYNSESEGKINVYLDNTALDYSNKITEAILAPAEGWQTAHVTVFLRQGINIVDIDSEAAVDYMRVIRAKDGYSQTVEAEDADGDFETAVSGDVTYVREIPANGGALEFTVTVPEDGTYKMRVFQSNDDLCGTHSYNIKIIDRYAVFEVNGERAGRYFFPNSFSDDTFLERTVPVELKAGENRIRVYNDDSWQVFWGGSTSEPGTDRLENFTPNFDKFIITPAVVTEEMPEEEYAIKPASTENGYIYADKNTAKAGERVRLFLLPDGRVKRLTVNGEDVTALLETEDNTLYTAEITVEGETDILAEFSPAMAGEYTDAEKNGYMLLDGKPYRIKSGNLFKNGDFADYSGENMEQWYVGVNTGGHPVTGEYQIPRINPDGSLENLVPLTDSGLLTVGGQEIDRPDTFYYGYDGSRTYLVEHMAADWHNCAWNGHGSLLAYVPVKPDTRYYFAFSAYTAGGMASVRCGAINMDGYVPESYSDTESLSFSGGGFIDCTNGNIQNVGGGWTRRETVIDSGDGDWFLFNAYWLQMAEYLCLGGFELYEIADVPAETVVAGIDTPKTMTVKEGGELTLPETVTAKTDGGEELTLAVNWLNAGGVDASAPNVYTVTGLVELTDDLYYTGDPTVRQRVVVEARYPAKITAVRGEGGNVCVEIAAYEAVNGTLYVSVGKSVRVKSEKLRLYPGETRRIELEPGTEPAEVMLWTDMLVPLSPKADINFQ